MAEELEVGVKATVDGVAESLTTGVISPLIKIREAIESFTGPVKAVIDQFKQIGEAFLIFQAVDSIEAFVEKLEEMATTALKLSAVLGTTVDAVSEFRGILIEVGGNEAAGTVRTMEHLQRIMSQSLADPADRASQAFKNLGISTATVKQNMNDFPAMLGVLRNAFQENALGANTTAAFYAILGRSFDTLVPVLRLTNDEFAKAQQRFRDTGSNIAPFADRLFASGEILRTFEQSLTGISLQLYSMFQPAMDSIILSLTGFAQSLSTAIAGLSNFVNYSSAVGELRDAFSTFKDSGSVLVDALRNIAEAFHLTDWGGISSEVEKIARSVRDTAKEFAWFAATVRDVSNWLQRHDEELKVQQALQPEINANEREYQKLLAIRTVTQAQAIPASKEVLDKIDAAVESAGTKLKNSQMNLMEAMGEIQAKYIDIALGNWEHYAETSVKIFDNAARNAKIAEAQGSADAFLPERRTQGTRQPPPLGGRGGGGGQDQKNYVQEWRTALDQQLMDDKNYFANSKATELAFWADKLAWTKAHQAEIIAEFERHGAKANAAKKKFTEMEREVERINYGLTKEETVRAFGEKQDLLAKELTNLRTNYDQRTITETVWYNQSLAIQQKVLDNLEATNQKGTKAWQAAEEKKLEITKTHVKDIAAEWDTALNWINSKIDTMLTGVLQGTQTFTQAMTKFFQNMAISFIEEIAKMTIRWLAFEALTIAGGADIAKAIGNPFAKVLGNIGTMIGGAGAVGGAAAGAAGGAAQAANTAKETAALIGNTAAATANTASTVTNTGGLGGMVSQAVSWIAGALGLTTATTASGAAAIDLGTSNLLLIETIASGLIPALVSLTAAVEISAATSKIPLASGAWNIPHTLGAVLHAGEMVLPQAIAEPLRSATAFGGDMRIGGGSTSVSSSSGGAGVTVNLHVNAVDASGVQKFLNSNSRQVGQAIATQIRNGDSSLSAAVRGI